MKFGFSSVFHFKRLENDDAIMFDPFYERKSVLRLTFKMCFLFKP